MQHRHVTSPILTTCTLVLLGLAAASPTLGQASDETIPVLSVSGSGEIDAEPDEASVRLGIEAENEAAAAAQREASTIATAILAALAEIGIEKEAIQTSALRLHPLYQQPAPRSAAGVEPRIIGYRASNEVTVELTDLDKVGPAIDAAIGAGANRVIGVDFGLQDDLEMRRQALAEAIREARQKAETMAQALGVPLGPVLEVQEGGVAVQPRYSPGVAMMRAESVGSPSTPVQPGKVTVRASVQVRYRLADSVVSPIPQ